MFVFYACLVFDLTSVFVQAYYNMFYVQNEQNQSKTEDIRTKMLKSFLEDATINDKLSDESKDSFFGSEMMEDSVVLSD